MKIFFGTVMYQKALKYIVELVETLNKQSTSLYTILIMTDQIEEEIISPQFADVKRPIEIVTHWGKTPQELRVDLLLEAKKRGGEILVLGDADDVFSPRRIELSVEALKDDNIDFVYNEICLWDLKKVFSDIPDHVDDIRYIRDGNFLGLSNTAVRIDKISERFICSLYDCNTFTFDWYFFSRLLIEGCKGLKLKDEAYTVYRIHEDSYAGIPTRGKANTEKEIAVKTRHYRLMKQYDQLFDSYYEAYTYKRIKECERSKGLYWWSLTEPIL